MKNNYCVNNPLLSLLWAIVLCLSISCGEGSLIDTSPAVSIIGISPDTLLEFQDSLVISFTYLDGDGDLGHIDPNFSVVELQDSRISMPENYHILPLVSADSLPMPITGTIHLKARPTFVLGSATIQSFRYGITLIDRAGHRSNTALSPQVVVRK